MSDEPSCFDFGSTCGISSDSFSYLDMDVSAQGNGGTRMMHHYVTCDNSQGISINTPQNNYSKERMGNIDMESLQQQRNNEIGYVPQYRM